VDQLHQFKRLVGYLREQRRGVAMEQVCEDGAGEGESSDQVGARAPKRPRRLWEHLDVVGDIESKA
jgi:hypothetical protein